MPIYEYRCESCGHDFETMQKMADDPLTECPECHEPALKKLISAGGFILKGTGWYQTDFKHSGKKPPEKKPAEKKLDKKVESKPAAKSKSKSKSSGD